MSDQIRRDRADIAPPPMSGIIYNQPNNGYDSCLRGIQLFCQLAPGKFPAKATLIGGFIDPVYRLQVIPNHGSTGHSVLFKEATYNEPPKNFNSHAQCTGTYDLGYPTVDVMVEITPTQRGFEVSITPV